MFLFLYSLKFWYFWPLERWTSELIVFVSLIFVLLIIFFVELILFTTLDIVHFCAWNSSCTWWTRFSSDHLLTRHRPIIQINKVRIKTSLRFRTALMSQIPIPQLLHRSNILHLYRHFLIIYSRMTRHLPEALWWWHPWTSIRIHAENLVLFLVYRMKLDRSW